MRGGNARTARSVWAGLAAIVISTAGCRSAEEADSGKRYPPGEICCFTISPVGPSAFRGRISDTNLVLYAAGAWGGRTMERHRLAEWLDSPDSPEEDRYAVACFLLEYDDLAAQRLVRAGLESADRHTRARAVTAAAWHVAMPARRPWAEAELVRFIRRWELPGLTDEEVVRVASPRESSTQFDTEDLRLPASDHRLVCMARYALMIARDNTRQWEPGMSVTVMADRQFAGGAIPPAERRLIETAVARLGRGDLTAIGDLSRLMRSTTTLQSLLAVADLLAQVRHPVSIAAVRAMAADGCDFAIAEVDAGWSKSARVRNIRVSGTGLAGRQFGRAAAATALWVLTGERWSP